MPISQLNSGTQPMSVAAVLTWEHRKMGMASNVEQGSLALENPWPWHATAQLWAAKLGPARALTQRHRRHKNTHCKQASMLHTWA